MYKKITESAINPTILLKNKAVIFPFACNGVYIAKSINSESKKAIPLANAILSPPSSKKDSNAPIKIAMDTQILLEDS